MTRLTPAAIARLALLLCHFAAVGVLSAQVPWDVEILDSGLPATLEPGETVRVMVTVVNRGTEGWDPEEGFALAAHWLTPDDEVVDWDGPRTPFEGIVAPGVAVKVLAVVAAPRSVGQYVVQWDVVQEGVRWISQDDATPVVGSDISVEPSIDDSPACVGGRLGVALTGVIFLLVLGARRRTDWVRSLAGRGDLAWLVLVPLAAERSVVEGTFGGGVVTVLCLTAVASLVALVSPRLRPWLAWVIGWSMVTVFVGDRVYLRFFADLPSVGSFETLGQTDEIGRSIISLFNGCDVLFLLAGLAGGGVALAARLIGVEIGSVRRRAAAAALMCAAAGIGLWWAAERPIHRQVFRRVFVAKKTGVAAAHVLDIGRAVRNGLRRTTVSSAEIDRIEQWFRGTADDRRGAGPIFGAARDLNVVMIQAESVQAFVVGLEVGGRLVMPHLTRWATEGLWFTEVTDQTGHGRSSDAELMTQTSILPLSDGAAAFEAATNRFTSLAGVLADRGYRTVSAVPFDRAFWNRGISHRAYGYDVNLFAPDFEPGRAIGWGLNDRDFLGQMGDRLADLPRPFCAWMLTLSLHHPFEGFPDDLEELDVGPWDGGPVGEYLHTMHYLDQALGDLEGRLEAAGLLEETVIVLWGDHDAGFEWTRDIAGLMGVSPDQTGWYRSQRVPLIIKAPRRLGLVGLVDRPAGHVDVAPTVANLLGIDGAEFAWMGRNLLGRRCDQPVVGEYDCWSTRTHVFLQGDDGTLEAGKCLERPSLSRQPAADCDTAFRAAHDRIAIAQKVLRFDLQERLTARLGVSER
ncbi:MAG: LTA synthase family protein [Acidobacteria bacterium]|nr:LTA synthase family protein [Acidobacteriota bacterium]